MFKTYQKRSKAKAAEAGQQLIANQYAKNYLRAPSETHQSFIDLNMETPKKHELATEILAAIDVLRGDKKRHSLPGVVQYLQPYIFDLEREMGGRSPAIPV